MQTYLAGVEGIDKAVKEAQDNPTGGAPDISGITAPDDTTLVIKLTDTTSLGVIGALTLPVSAPGAGGVREAVRRGEPVDLRRAPGLDRPVHDRDELRRRTRRSTWCATRTGTASDADFRPAYLDEITFQEGFADTVSAGKKILSGNAEVNGDFSAPPSVIKQAATTGEPKAS